MTHRIDILARHHARLLEIVGVAMPLITSSAAGADLEGLRHLRAEMADALAAYQRFVHDEIFERVAREGTPDALAGALDVKLDCIKLDQDYAAFRQHWSRNNALENWTEYRLSALRMTKQIRDHVRRARERRCCWTERRSA